jgi:pimeloyl-ACP methyl ester carboxylesterase
MPTAIVNGATINYEIIGDSGPWLSLSPGGRRGMDEMLPLAKRMSGYGYRVVLHDRRNCGLSDIALDPSQPEYEVWADDLYALMSQLDALPAIVGGSSSGCRLSVLFAKKYPQAVNALLLFRITGGRFAVERLSQRYYTQYIEAAQKGGMALICETDHFRDLIELRPDHRATLMAMDPAQFIEAMQAWNARFIEGLHMPIIGATEQDLNAIAVPTLIIPGNDRTHNHAVAAIAHGMIPHSELHDLFPGDLDMDIIPMEDWAPKEAEMAALFADFLKRAGFGG